MHLLKPGDKIYVWLTEQFAGGSLGKRILWRPNTLSSTNPDTSKYSSYCCPPGEHAPGVISVNATDGSNDADPEAMLSALVFEIFNIRNAVRFEEIRETVRKGQIDKAEYIRKISQLEYLAGKRCAQFFRDVWLPECKKQGIGYQSRFWRQDMPDTYEQWVAKTRKTNGYPDTLYGPQFDSLSLQARNPQRIFSETTRILKQTI